MFQTESSRNVVMQIDDAAQSSQVPANSEVPSSPSDIARALVKRRWDNVPKEERSAFGRKLQQIKQEQRDANPGRATTPGRFLFELDIDAGTILALGRYRLAGCGSTKMILEKLIRAAIDVQLSIPADPRKTKIRAPKTPAEIEQKIDSVKAQFADQERLYKERELKLEARRQAIEQRRQEAALKRQQRAAKMGTGKKRKPMLPGSGRRASK